MNDIAQRIHDEIVRSGYSYGELSKLTGIPKSAIQRYATGETEKIPLDRLSQLAGVLNVTSAFLMGWEDHATEENDDLRKLAVETVEESRLLELWRRADGIDKQTIWNILSRYDEDGAVAHSSAL